MGKHHVLHALTIKQGLLLTCIIITITIFSIYSTKYQISFWISHSQLPKATYYPNLMETETNQHKTKLILYWNTFFGQEDMYFGNGSRIFKNCPVSNCLATSNREFTSIEKFDAIIFHAARYASNRDGFPTTRSIHQKYIFYSMETPFHTNFDDRTINNFYNLTMTYRNDSDIPKPYGLVIANETNYVLPTIQEIENKTKKVAWFVSNCYSRTSNRRFKYAKELSKYIPVDIYGTCGSLKCTNRTACYKMLEKKYKFYLSFENSMCKDYVTEKVFNVLDYNVIPVVLGIFKYDHIVPPNSVINTWHFNNPKDLAKYLLKLDANPKEYVKYFEWKKSFSVIHSNELALCRMCELLNKPMVYSWYENVKEWFYGFNCVV